MALINASISLLYVFDDQGPFIRVLIVAGQEPLICRVGVLAHRQDVNVTVANPGDLRKNTRKNTVISLAMYHTTTMMVLDATMIS